MSRWFPALALAGVVLAGTGSVQAQESETLTATIPFDFKVGQATLPAGQYSLSYDAAESPGVLTVRGKDYVYGGPSGGKLSNFKNELTGCGPFLHDDPVDRPPAIFGGVTSLHFRPDRPAYLLLPIIPASG